MEDDLLPILHAWLDINGELHLFGLCLTFRAMLALGLPAFPP